MASYFISDLHLSERSPEIFHGLQLFLSQIANQADALYLLGDFFDAWIGDDDDSPFVAKVKQCLKEYTDAGTNTYFIHGNRDFLLGQSFAKETGITLLPELQCIEVNGSKVLLMHGDTLCTQDREYMQFRAMVHSAKWQDEVLSLPLEQRRMMAAQLREKSLSLNAMKAEDIMDVTPAEVTATMLEHDVKTLIHGHTHRPNTHEFKLMSYPAQRIVLGDWSKTQGWYIEANNQGDLELNTFNFS